MKLLATFIVKLGKKKEEEEEGRKIHAGKVWYVALSTCAVTEGKV